MYFLAYDLGTGGNKASLYDCSGQLLAANFEPYPTYYPQSGWHEQRPSDWWTAVVKSTQTLLGQTNIDRSAIGAIALSGHSLGCVPLDKAGTVLLDATPIWSDSRAGAQAQKFFQSFDYKEWYMTTGAGFPPGLYTIFKLLWYKENLPQMFDRLNRFIGTKDYINYRLTGRIATDYSYASGCGGYSLTEWKYSDRIISAAGLPREIFPETMPSTEIIGTLTTAAAEELGLPASVQVAAGGVDNSCMALGAKCYGGGRSYASLGSSSWIAVTDSKPLLDFRFKPYVFTHVVPGQFASATAIFSAGTTLKWVRDNFCRDLVLQSNGSEVWTAMIDEAMTSAIGANGLILNPSFAGGSALDPSPDIRGALMGIDLSNTRADVIRAALEGIALNLRLALNALAELTTIDPTMVLVGGGAINRNWRRIYADTFNLRVEKTNIDQDAAALGAAAVAAVGVGQWPDFSMLDSIHKTVEITEPIEENVKRYDKVLELFCRYRDAIAG